MQTEINKKEKTPFGALDHFPLVLAHLPQNWPASRPIIPSPRPSRLGSSRSPFSRRVYASWVRAVSFASSKHLQTSRRDLGLWDSRTWMDLHAPTQIRLLRESVAARTAATESSAWKSPSPMSFSPEFVATSRNPRVMVLPPSSRTLPSWSIKPLGRQSSSGHTS
jgi:hypothetical protein